MVRMSEREEEREMNMDCLISGHRSLTRDLEVQVAIETTNSGLKEALHKVRSTYTSTAEIALVLSCHCFPSGEDCYV